tara:strand:+ start:285 stop:509 length:225 start_codon:yes stop_codon:yes gene_type:complete
MDKEYQIGDLVRSTVIGLQDFEFNTFGQLGIVVELVEHHSAAKIWWVGESEPKTVLLKNFELISRGKKSKKTAI